MKTTWKDILLALAFVVLFILATAEYTF